MSKKLGVKVDLVMKDRDVRIYLDEILQAIGKIEKHEFLNSDLKEKCTSIFNLFELLGIVSFNLSTTDLKK